MNGIQFWLSYNNGKQKLRLPVNPEMINVQTSFGYDDIDVSMLGEYSVILEQKLKQFSFDCHFPATYNPAYCEYTSFPTPQGCIDLIESWRASRSPIQLIVTGTKINFTVTIRDFNYDLVRAGYNGDVFYHLDLKEYKYINLNSVNYGPDPSNPSNTIATNNKNTRPSSKQKPTTYKTTSKDTLWGIAKKTMGNGNDWTQIYAVPSNKKLIGSNPNKLKAGMVLTIP